MNRFRHITNVLMLLTSAVLLFYLSIYGYVKSMRNTGALLIPACFIVRSCYLYIKLGPKPFATPTNTFAAFACKYNGFIFMPQIAIGAAWFFYWAERCNNAYSIYRLAGTSDSRIKAYSDYKMILSEIDTFAIAAIPLIVVLILTQFWVSFSLARKNSLFNP